MRIFVMSAPVEVDSMRIYMMSAPLEAHSMYIYVMSAPVEADQAQKVPLGSLGPKMFPEAKF